MGGRGEEKERGGEGAGRERGGEGGEREKVDGLAPLSCPFLFTSCTNQPYLPWLFIVLVSLFCLQKTWPQSLCEFVLQSHRLSMERVPPPWVQVGGVEVGRAVRSGMNPKKLHEVRVRV